MASENKTHIVAEPGRQELYIFREFDAPRTMIYNAFIYPELLVKWYGPRGIKMEIEDYEPKRGGSYRYFYFYDESMKFCFNGVFHECTAPERIIQTAEFENIPDKGHVCLTSTNFEVLPGDRTKLIIHELYQSVEDRDAAIKAGMESGVVEQNIRLDELLEEQLKR